MSVLVLGVLAGCADQAEPTPFAATPTSRPAPTVTAAIPSPTPQPTQTPMPTFTATPLPTATPTFDPGVVILPTVAIPTYIPTPTPINPLQKTLDAIGYRVAIMRELTSYSPTDREFITRDELIVRLGQDLEEDREDIYELQQLYRTLGVIGEDTVLYDLILGLYGEGVLGFFDTEEEKLYVVQDPAEFGPQDEATFAHEFTHGLQQRNFDIHSISEELEGNSDRSRAFRGLVEGDATISDTIYTFQYMEEEERIAIREASASAPSDAYFSAPHLIQRTFVFPYREGANFVVSLFLATNSWQEVNRAFEQIPQSTEQILHPQKYVSGEGPLTVELPDVAVALGEGWSELRRDTLGEFLLLAYLETAIDPEEAAVAAEGWGGDLYTLLSGPQEETLLVSLTSWDTAEDARQFFDRFVEFMQAREEMEWDVLAADQQARILVLPDQTVYLDLDTPDTLLIFAPDAITLEAARATIRGDAAELTE